jgi:hypothetical protein
MTGPLMPSTAARTNMQSASSSTSYAAVKPAQSSEAVFVDMADSIAVEALQTRYDNRDLRVSVRYYTMADLSAPSGRSLHFRIGPASMETVRRHALETAYYMAEHLGIPSESVDLIYNGGGLVCDKPVTQSETATSTPAEVVVLVSPAVFNGGPTPLMPTLNHNLARQMRAAGIQSVDLDIYIRDQFVPLVNSLNGATGHFVIPLRLEELLYLDVTAITELSAQPRPDDTYAVCRPVPEAAEWFAEALKEEEKRLKRQSQLREELLRRGWFIPPCVRRLGWADMSEDQALEACRIIAGFYPFVNASEDEVDYHIRRLGQHHGLRDYLRLRNITTFGRENPAFPGCDHLLLQQFCPAGKCLITELIAECENPLLFTWGELRC